MILSTHIIGISGKKKRLKIKNVRPQAAVNKTIKSIFENSI
jgi:hypothetical protein